MENELIIDGQVIDLSETQKMQKKPSSKQSHSLRMKARMTTVKRWQLSLKNRRDTRRLRLAYW